jgi:hypothetical protein
MIRASPLIKPFFKIARKLGRMFGRDCRVVFAVLAFSHKVPGEETTWGNIVRRQCVGRCAKQQ